MAKPTIHPFAALGLSRRRILLATASLSFLGARLAMPESALALKKVRRPFPWRQPYAEGTLFPNHKSPEELETEVRSAYDDWKAAYLVDAGDDASGETLYRIAFGKQGTDNYDITVSEGQGYGMLIVAHLAGHDSHARTIYDGLYRFARANPSSIDSRMMRGRVPPDVGIDTAFDGDCDIAYSLLLAHAQWGSEVEIDYQSAAQEYLAALFESTIGPVSHYPLLGDWTDPNGAKYNEWTPRTSDLMLGHFRAFDRAVMTTDWGSVIDASSTLIGSLQENFSPKTGLLPDFVEPVSSSDHSPRPADADFLEGPTDGEYGYNAGRTPWRLGTDAALTGDPTTLEQVRLLSGWANAKTHGHPERFRSGYELDGKPLKNSNYFSTFFVAPLGVAAMSSPDQQDWLNTIWDSVASQRVDYYEDSVTLLCMLVMSGCFWDGTVGE